MEGDDGLEEGGVEMPAPARKPKAKAKNTAKARASPKSGCRGRGRGLGRARGGGGRGAHMEDLETPEPRGGVVENETPEGASLKKPATKKVRKDQGTKEVKGLPLHLREECKKFLICSYAVHVGQNCTLSIQKQSQANPAWCLLPG